jgi:5-methyltetrahydropteroyltriglutamate--homocysteine methyltransferase
MSIFVAGQTRRRELRQREDELTAMKRSSDRILTTHTGSLIRTRKIIEGMKARSLERPYDQEQLTRDIRTGIADVVRKQVEIGIDIPSDGEFGRAGFKAYMNERLSGLEPRALEPGEIQTQALERIAFPEFYEQYGKMSHFIWMLPEVSMDEVARSGADQEHNRSPFFRLTGPVSYIGQLAVYSDIETFNSALQGLAVADAFIPAATPLSRRGDTNFLSFYPSEEAYLYALADALHEEYKAITDAGFILQLDFAVLNPQEHLLKSRPDASDRDKRHAMELGVEITNHALRDIPEERVRYHHCWGSDNRPHLFDVPLKEFAEIMLKINAQAYGIEAANPRHEHEWMVWKDVKLPDGKILIPGLISQSTNVVEHPELVAWRLKNFASMVGRENVIAGVDCGFSQEWHLIRVHPSVQWAKLQSLVEGARLASKELWP